MKKIIMALTISLVFSTASFAQLQSYSSPFGGTYLGDFKSYEPNDISGGDIQQSKVNMMNIILLNDNETLSNNVDVREMADYIAKITTVMLSKLNHFTKSNTLVLEVIVNKQKHRVQFAYQEDLAKADNEVLKIAYKEVNSVSPFKVTTAKKDIKLHIYYKVDTTLPVHK